MAARGGLQLLSSSSSRTPARSDEQQLVQEARKALKSTFGFDAFRGRQLAAILAALQGKDCFVLMPTGGGKSLCYSLVPAIRPGVVLVVSPLISLMQDQVLSLRAHGLRADFLSSTRTEADRRRLLADMQQRTPDTQLLYVTPELLATESFLRCLRNAYAAGSLLLFAVDEAHCVSSWGHSFRHTYRRLWVVRQELPRLPIMALTATASERVQRDIVSQLRLREPLMLRDSFNRPNISYEVRYLDLLKGTEGRPLATPLPDIIRLLAAQAKLAAVGSAHQQELAEQQHQHQQQCPRLDVPCTVIYCRRREDADRVAAALRKRGIACAAYHAGLPDATRAGVLADWQARRLDVVAATVSFGMGIDRADVRYVLHYSLPSSLEAYYQEAGRAGRDGTPSQSIVYYSTDDRQRQEFVIGKGDDRLGKLGTTGSRSQAGGSSDEAHPNQLQQFAQVVDYCLSAQCRRATVLGHFGERLPAAAHGKSGPGAAAAGNAGNASHACCDVCTDGQAVASALKELASAGAQRRQHFAGGKHRLDFSGGGGDRGALEFETSRPHEGLDYDAEGPSRALQESDAEDEDNDGIASSSDEEAAVAAAAALQQAQRRGSSSSAAVFAAMARAEAQHEQQHGGAGGKRARLLQKLEGGSGGGGSIGGSSSGSVLTDALLSAATRQLSSVLSGNAALAAELAGDVASVAAALVRQLAGGVASKPVFQGKLSNLAVQLKKAGAASQVAALVTALGSSSSTGCRQQQAGPEARVAAVAAAVGRPTPGSAAGAAAGQPSHDQPPTTHQELQQQVAEALRLAAAASPSSPASSAHAAAIDAATAALAALAAAPVSVALLQATRAGKQVQQLKKHAIPAVAAAAAAVVAAWKAQLVAVGAQ